MLKFSDTIVIVPKEADGVQYKPLTNYDRIGIDSAVNKVVKSGMPAISSMLPKTIIDYTRDTLKEVETSLKTREAEIESGQCDELRDLQAELDRLNSELEAKRADLLEALKDKFDKLEESKRKLNRQMFMLDTQIYGIRCFTGEVIDFIKLRDGEMLNRECPLVVYQKLRYLDEELGSALSLYGITFNQKDIFEQVLQTRDDMVDFFCPSEKCISVVRISRDGKCYGSHDMFGNVLKEYEIEHGDAIGILVRNKDVLYIGWADPERITLEEDVFYQGKEEIHQVSDNIEDMKGKSSSNNEIISRYFLFNVLQGCIANNQEGTRYNIIDVPEGTSFLNPNKYIVYSAADAWISASKYPPLSELLSECSENAKVGDNVLIMLKLNGDNHFRTWSNNRGRGQKNIVGNLGPKNNKIYKINMKDNADSIAIYHTHIVGGETPEEFEYLFENSSTKASAEEYFQRMCNIWNISFDPSYIEYRLEEHLYISILKDNSEGVWDGYSYHERQKDSRVNFEIDADEFMNLELLNSAWLEDHIASRSTDDVWVGGQNVNYRYLIVYLNKALSHIREREVTEKKMLEEAGFTEFDRIDWRDALSRYKIKTGRHVLKTRWAKQLADTLNRSINISEQNR